MLSSFHLNGHTLRFYPQAQKLEISGRSKFTSCPLTRGLSVLVLFSYLFSVKSIPLVLQANGVSIMHLSSLHFPQSGSACIATQSSFRRLLSTSEGSPTAHLRNKGRQLFIMILVACFSVVGTCLNFSRGLALATCFSALGTGYVFSHA